MSFVSIDFGTTRCSIVTYVAGLLELVRDPEDNDACVAPCVAFNSSTPSFDVKSVRKSKFIVELKQYLCETASNLNEKLANRFITFEERCYRNFPSIFLLKMCSQQIQLSTFITILFSKSVKWATELCGKPITQIIMNLPQEFAEEKRQFLYKMMFPVKGHTITDEMAAALVYDRQRSSNETIKVIIFHQGAKSISASIYQFSEQDPVQIGYVQVARGGSAYDINLLGYVRKQCSEEQIKLLDGDRIQRHLMLIACRQAKHELTTEMEAHINLQNEDTGLSIQQTISRELFEHINKNEILYVKCSIQCLLEQSGINENEIAEVVLVGGATRVPKLRQVISDHFEGRVKVNVSFCFDHVFACGGAIQLAKINQLHILSLPKDLISLNYINTVLSDPGVESLIKPTLMESIGLFIEDLPPITMFYRNDTYPCRRDWIYHTPTDHYIPSMIRVWIGRYLYRNIEDIDYLAKISFPEIPPTPKGTPVLRITFELDENGCLTIRMIDRCSGMTASTIIPNFIRNHLNNDEGNLYSINRLDRCLVRLQSDVKNILHTLESNHAKTNLPTQTRYVVKQKCDAIKAWLSSNQQKSLDQLEVQTQELFDSWLPCIPATY